MSTPPPSVRAGGLPQGRSWAILCADAVRLGLRAVGIELNPNYAALARGRIISDAPMFLGAKEEAGA